MLKKILSVSLIGLLIGGVKANASVIDYGNKGFAYIDEKKNEYECTPYILGDFSINFDDKNSLEKFVEKNLKFNRKEVHVIDIITSNDMVKFELSDGSIAISDKKNSKYTFKVNGLNDFVVNLSHENDLIDVINIYIDMNNQGNF